MTKEIFIILAAGRGTRLHPITQGIPKALVSVVNRPIISHTLEILAERVQESNLRVVLVVGHLGGTLAEYVSTNYPFVNIIWNHEYATTNNMFSLYLSLTMVEPDARVTYMNGDCIYAPDILRNLADKVGSFILCDLTAPYNSESMKITLSNGTVQHISKHATPGASTHISCDLYSYSAEAISQLRKIIFGYIHKAELNLWSEVALNQSMKSGAIQLSTMGTDGLPWYEIDSHEDLANAEKLFSRIR